MNSFKKAIVTICLLVMVGVTAMPDPANAQWLVSEPIILGSITAKGIKDETKEALWNALITVAKVTLINAAKNFFQDIAYQSAVYLGSGGQGQKPLIFTDSWDSYLKDAAQNAAGNAIQDTMAWMGKDVCPPSGGSLDAANMAAGVINEYIDETEAEAIKRKEAEENASKQKMNGTEGDAKIQANKAASNVPGGEELLKKANPDYDPALAYYEDTTKTKKGKDCLNGLITKNPSGFEEKFVDKNGKFNQKDYYASVNKFIGKENDLALETKIAAKVGSKVGKKIIATQSERFVNKGYKDTATKVAGYVQTPGTFVAEAAFGMTPDKLAKTDAEIAKMSSGETLDFLLANTASVFLNTASQTMIKRLTDEGFLLVEQILGTGDKNGNNSLLARTGSVGRSGREISELAFAELKTPAIISGNEFYILNEFAACPTEFIGLNNCVVDQGVVTAANLANQGKPVTIKEAMDLGYLRGDWKLYPPEHDLNTSKNCYASGYCYSNLTKLRRARIIPLGFEIAAQLSPKENPWQLKTVVENFYACSTLGKRDAEHPFCHLIDPNWVIKSPPVRCNAQAYGPLLAGSGVSTRQEMCVDLQDCPVTDENGKCQGAWGYCIEEKNTWNLGGDTCPAQFASCQTYTSALGTQDSYLTATVDSSICDESNVGCRRYFNTKVKDTQGELAWFQSEQGDDPYKDTDYNSDGTLTAAGMIKATGTYTFQNGHEDPNTNPYVTQNLTVEPPSSVSYFNRAVQQCNPKDNGCTRVIREDKSELSVRIAPDYLKCYDLHPEQAGLQLPFTVEQANEIAKRQGCDAFAPVCAEEELGCAQYIPDIGGATVTGIANNQDQCPSQCVGYNAFAQAGTNFESAPSSLQFFIPKTATECPFSAIGCDEFTNLDVQSAGGEGKEYYSFIRQCKKPEGQVPNFYTWQGSEQDGYKIELHHLEADAIGNPAYNTTDIDALAKFQVSCNAVTYGSDPDCREVYNDVGTVSYRLFSKTITISEDCHPLRRSNGTQTDCSETGGEWINGSCTYQTITQESIACQPQFAGCRAYNGNAGSGTIKIVNDRFEDGLSENINDTNGTEISNESLIVGGHSVKAGNEFEYAFKPQKGTTYVISFWAKGSGKFAATLDYQYGPNELIKSANFTDLPNQPNSAQSPGFSPSDTQLTPSWRPYTFGPITLDDDVIESQGAANIWIGTALQGNELFIDNLVLTQGDILALVKNSWKTPNICDADQSDILPGAALGCQSYSYPNKANKAFLKSFTGLCREEAIGCENVIDTRNNKNEFAEEYNTNSEDTKGIKNINPNDNILVPPDRVLRVVMQQQYLCAATAQGCAEYGFKHLEGTGSATQEVTDSVYLINNPDQYDQTACASEAVACESYTSKSGTSYFKDPNVLGRKCEYRASEDPNSPVRGGWYKLGITDVNGNPITDEPCSPGFFQQGKEYGIWKQGDAGYEGYVGECSQQYDQCSELIDKTDIDQKTGKPKSYYIIKNNKIDISSCQGKVSRQEGCVLFDETSNPHKPYSADATYEASEKKQGKMVNASDYPVQVKSYKTELRLTSQGLKIPCDKEIFNNILTYDSPKELCELFGERGQVYGTSYTEYCTPDKTAFVNGITMEDFSKRYINYCTDSSTASNIILKVTRDRQCSAWLSPNSYVTASNDSLDKQKQVTGLGLCTSVFKEKTGTVQCAQWLDPQEHPFYATVLNADNYAKRDVSFSGKEFSGLSASNKFLPYHFTPYTFSTSDSESPLPLAGFLPQDSASALVATVKNSHIYDSSTGTSTIAPTGSTTGICLDKKDETSCGKQNDGVCVSGECIYKLDGNITTTQIPIGSACRGFPEETSPYPTSIIKEWNTISPKQNTTKKTVDPAYFINEKYAKANYCQDEEECSCSYRKSIYGNGVRTLYQKLASKTPEGICMGGFYADDLDTPQSKTGVQCGPSFDEFCSDDRKTRNLSLPQEEQNLSLPIRQDGICQYKEAHTQEFQGWEGYCIEQDLRQPIQDEDLSYACNSWYPIDSGPGLTDINNQNKTAGYQHNTDSGVYWCAESNGNMSREKETTTVDFNNDGIAEPVEGYTYQSVSTSLNFPMPEVLGTYIDSVTGNEEKITGKSFGVIKTIPPSSFVDLRRPEQNGEPIHAYELDGIQIITTNSAQIAQDMFIGADNNVRCYGSEGDHDNMGGASGAKTDCSEYATKVRLSNPGAKELTDIPDGTKSLSATHRFVNVDKTEDWIMVYANDESYDDKDGACSYAVPNIQHSSKYPDTENKVLWDGVFASGDGNPFYDNDGTGKSDFARFTQDEAIFNAWCNAMGVGKGQGKNNKCNNVGDHKIIRAVRAHFNTNQELENIQLVQCQSTPKNNDWNVNIKLHFREQCNYIAQAEKNGESAAYTQRLWKKQQDSRMAQLGGQFNVPLYDRIATLNRFASITDPLNLKTSEGLPRYRPFYLTNDNIGWNNPMLLFDEDSVPYGSIQTTEDPKNLTSPVYTFARVKDGDIRLRPYKDTGVDINQGKILSQAVSFGCIDGGCGEGEVNLAQRGSGNNNFIVNTQRYFNMLFAKVQSLFKRTGAVYNTESTNTLVGNQDTRQSQGRPPRIASLRLQSPISNNVYPLDELDAFNVNETDGYVKDEFGHKTDKRKFVFGVDNLSATIRFAGWADTDQMPLKRIYVKWGDGNTSGGADAQYKNKKPYCSTQEEPIGYCYYNQIGGNTSTDPDTFGASKDELNLPNITCKEDKECQELVDKTGNRARCSTSHQKLGKTGFVFGNDPDACQEGHFEYQHIYTHDDSCGAQGTPNANILDKNPGAYPKRIAVSSDLFNLTDVDGYDYSLLRDLGVREGDVLCIYKPGVQVKDNWGWCNGTCGTTGFNANETGCFEGSGFAGKDDCEIEEARAWTEFAGEIILVADD